MHPNAQRAEPGEAKELGLTIRVEPEHDGLVSSLVPQHRQCLAAAARLSVQLVEVDLLGRAGLGRAVDVVHAQTLHGARVAGGDRPQRGGEPRTFLQERRPEIPKAGTRNQRGLERAVARGERLFRLKG